MKILLAATLVFLTGGIHSVLAKTVRIVSWNASPSLYETLEKRAKDFREFDKAMKPDVLVLIEVAGQYEVRQIIKALGWKRYHAVVTNWASLNHRVHFALEAAVISRVPIIKATEFDASPDGHLEVFTQRGPLAGATSEKKLSSKGIKGFGHALGRHDRGTIRVDLANGLSIFPLHLKSNRNGACIDLADARKFLLRSKIAVPSKVDQFLAAGFARATQERLRNAKKRERVMAATVKVANVAIAEGRTVVIAGDMNTI